MGREPLRSHSNRKRLTQGSAVSHYKGMKKRFTFDVLARRGFDAVESAAACDFPTDLGATIIIDVA